MSGVTKDGGPAPKFTPDNCPHCEYDRKALGGGWIEFMDNGPIVPCPVCNDDGSYHFTNEVARQSSNG